MQRVRDHEACLMGLLVLVALGCGGDDDGSTCGDGACSPGESTLSCPADCQATGPVCGDGICSGTESSTTCSADCAISGGPICGDRVCSGTETPSTCPSDCASPCSTSNPASCTGETICLDGSCVAAFGRAYRIVVHSAVVPQFKPDGSTWDAVGGAPDPFAVIFLNSQSLGTTPVVPNNFTPVWNAATPPTPIAAGSTLRVDVYDEDVSAHDGILSCSATPLSADILHVGEFVCSGTLGQLRILLTTN